jgi:methyl-accepting chemotaxis protein
MRKNWTFGQRLGAGFAVTVALTVAIGVVAVRALKSVAESKDQVILVDAQVLLDAQRLATARAEKSMAARGFLLSRDGRFIDQIQEARAEFDTVLGRLRSRVPSEEGRLVLENVAKAEADHQEALDKIVALRRGDTPAEAVSRAFDEQLGPKSRQLDALLDSFVSREERLLEEGRQTANATASAASTMVLWIAAIAVACAVGIAFLLTRTLGRQIGSAVGRVESSSAELQAAATQQAAGAKEQSTAMTEITTTISELLATSRQIAESARRVAQIAGQTATSSRSGEATVDKAHESIGGIRRQVDLIVGHMLELGKRSQQIGAVADIVSELAEQTNILAINATIEAAGAGEAGKRFAVVADEIRKLADRVGGSAKDIRGQIEEVRAAVNTTVMATESGSKAVDAGSRQFAEVASGFKQISGLVSTTTEAAREIELSTQQQTTAVEQVNVAISNVAQATRETEASSGQTLQTAGLLASLSRELLRLVRPEAAA